MSVKISNQFKLELSKLEQGALLDLYEIDLRAITNSKGQVGDVYRFYAGTNELKSAVIWQGKAYQPYPIQASGFDKSGQGPSNRPTLSISNLFGIVTGIASSFDEAVGAVVRRRRVYMHYLDAVNFKDGNKQADPTQEILSYYIIEQLSSLKHDVATFTLALPTETDNALLPARVIMADTCTWVYRSVECGYTGKAVADEKDQPTTDINKDKCSQCMTGCNLRENTRNFGGFVSVNKVG
ncbi:phage minor tail protein L [Pasteurellaceae bacterium USgator11]|nr:phage minor tail protein L [Pasteurellaceae bacterium USgator41]TNG94318.1 phage minor tail protein L [Pasteurellaceae bacterium UScroc12]TNG98821.1 phage minor tail protein L [Pasteurellaceae bacterium USgator11]TNG99200.1 phage minor tail protein L [Pasteurellaceae bacterium UScroc31]